MKVALHGGPISYIVKMRYRAPSTVMCLVKLIRLTESNVLGVYLLIQSSLYLVNLNACSKCLRNAATELLQALF